MCVCPPLQTRLFAVAVAPDLTLLVSLLYTEQGAPSSAHRDADAGALEHALIQVKTRKHSSDRQLTATMTATQCLQPDAPTCARQMC